MTTPDPTTAALAAELAELRTAHQHLTDTVDHLLDAVENLHPHHDRTTPGDWSWTDMPSDRATALLAQLHAFVDHINTREEFGPTQRIPPCWPHHTRAVEDLTALYAAWQDAYQGATGPTSAPIHYRDRWLYPTLTRLTDLNTPLRRCIDKNQHTPWHPPTDTMLDADGEPLDRTNHQAQHNAASVLAQHSDPTTSGRTTPASTALEP